MSFLLEQARYTLPLHERQAENVLAEGHRIQTHLVKTLSQLLSSAVHTGSVVIHFDYTLPEAWVAQGTGLAYGGLAQARDDRRWGLYEASCNGYRVETLQSRELLLLQQLSLTDLLSLLQVVRQGYARLIPRGSILQDLHERWLTFPVLSLDPSDPG